ncbi:hypothetical protein BJ085DRAFT_8392, partial [Dimargaris cristalligena]
DSDGSDSDGGSGKPKAHSKNRVRRDARMTLAELKQMVKKPELVEWVDVTGHDPKLLVDLKSHRNTVPVPVHWNRKRKYLQGKRGIEKAPFELPEFIKATGIQEMREAIKDKADQQKLKSKTRERMQPKMGKLGVDYAKLHDAFFRFQSKPRMTIHGQLYFEGKEFETEAKEYKPGELSAELIEALNMPPGTPSPWLINMQRYGPPPNYPGLVIPGLNAPIPEGAQWGFQPGGWGRPPVDEFNRPLYGDVFQNSNGMGAGQLNDQDDDPTISRKVLWGELESDEDVDDEEGLDESGSEEAGSEEEEEAVEKLAEGENDPDRQALTELDTDPDHIELRKDSRRGQSNTAGGAENDEDEAEEETKQLYQVLEPKANRISGMMGSEFVYDIPG